jgi:negative regulator of flagellin synthesis FlgM
MEINQIGQYQNDPAITGQSAARRAERNTSDSQTKTDPQSVRTPSDSVEISDRSRELARARQAVDAAPDVRTDKVASIKKRIEDGTYSVSPQALASKILEGLDA